MLFDRLKTQKYSSKGHSFVSDINSIILSIAPSQPVKNVIVYTIFTYYSAVWSQLTSCSGSLWCLIGLQSSRGSNRIKESEKSPIKYPALRCQLRPRQLSFQVVSPAGCCWTSSPWCLRIPRE